MPRTKLDALKRKRVEVKANNLIYRGILLEATEDEITIRTETRIVQIPMDRITSVKDPTAKEAAAPRFVDSSFYSADDPAGEPEKE
jgi:hypothetical protein